MRKLLSSILFLAALAALPLSNAWGQASCPISYQTPQIKTGTTYTVAPSDQCSLLDFTSSSAITVTLPNANTLPAGFTVTVKAGGSGAVTLSPTTSTIDGNTTATLVSGTSSLIWGNNINYYSSSGGGLGVGYLSNPNILENGDFLIDQEYAGASETVQTTLTRAIDRWFSIYTVSSSGGSAPSTQQVALSTGLTITGKELKLTNSSSGATGITAGMITRVQQSVEGSDIEDLNWNATTGGVPVTASGWIKSSIASADIGIALVGGSTYSYVHDCVASSTASTWTYCSFAVPAPGEGTWTISTGSSGLVFDIAFQCGSTFQTTANAWASGTYYCSPNQTQALGTNSSTIELAGWKLERGSTPTVFTSTPLATNLNILRRYYQSSFPLGTAPAQNLDSYVGNLCVQTASSTAGTAGGYVQFNPPMYASPTVTTYSPQAATANWYDETGSSAVAVNVDPATAKGTTGVQISTQTTSLTAAHTLCIGWSADSAL